MNNQDKPKDKKTDESLRIIGRQLYALLYNFFWVIIAIACAAVLIFGYQMFLLGKYESIVSNREITNKQQEYIDKLQYYNQLVDLRNTYNKISPEDRAKINQIVTTVNNQTELYREAEYIIKKNGLTVESIEPVTLDKSYDLSNISNTPKRSNLLNNMRLTITACKIANVNYESLLRVLRTFELNLRIMDVIKVEYDPAQARASIQFITYQF